MSSTRPRPGSRFDRLVSYLAGDSGNSALLMDALTAGYEERRFEEVLAVADGREALSSEASNLVGLSALASGRSAEAARIFAALSGAAPEDPVLRENLAWARTGQGDHGAVVDLVEGAGRTPALAALKVRSLHHLQRLDEALEIGDDWEGRTGSEDLWGALAVVALDAEQVDRAAGWAARAEGSPEGLSTIGMLELAEGDTAGGRARFEAAVALRPDSARGLLGLGLVALQNQDPLRAAELLDQAGSIFDTHLGTWAGAGWAWLLAGDPVKARDRFERVVALDDTFAEGHGGLAVLDVLEGRVEEGRRRAEIARRLDRMSLGAALAESLGLQAAGDGQKAERIIALAMTAPVGPGGRTIAQALARPARR